MKRYMRDIGPLDVLHFLPQSERNIILEYRGEVHFGPPYFALWIEQDGEYVGPGTEDLFGDKLFWSPDERYLVLERWRSLETPTNNLLILDLTSMQQCLAVELGANFLRTVLWHPEAGKGYRLMTYQTEGFRQHGQLVRVSAELAIDDMLGWEPINWLENVDDTRLSL